MSKWDLDHIKSARRRQEDLKAHQSSRWREIQLSWAQWFLVILAVGLFILGALPGVTAYEGGRAAFWLGAALCGLGAAVLFGIDYYYD